MKTNLSKIVYILTVCLFISLFFIVGIKMANDNSDNKSDASKASETSEVKGGYQLNNLPKEENTVISLSNITYDNENRYDTKIYGVTLEDAEQGDIETKQKYIWDFFISLGYSEVSTSAIIGNMIVEDPTLTGNNESISFNDPSSYTDGVIQWDPFDVHMSWANVNGYEWYDLEGQLVHVDEMIRTSWQQNRVDQLHGTYNGSTLYSITWEEFISCDNVAIATASFERGIEGSHDWEKDQDANRINNAYSIYNELSGK